MKEKIKKNLIGFVLGVITAFSISVIAATYFPSNQTTYDNSVSGLSSTNVQGAIDELYGVCFPPSAGDSILDKEPIVDTGDGLYKDEYEEGKYTYKGANPNNYVTFNNEEAGWRIISINSDGTIKIVKNEHIGDIEWDTSGSNNWNRPASLNTYLNSTYYNGLNSTAQSQIVEALYYAGAIIDDNNDVQEQISDEKAAISKVKVALPTASEYLRANSNKERCGTFSLNNSNFSTCSNSNWMINGSDTRWTLSSNFESSYYVVCIFGAGNLEISCGVDYALNGVVYPVVTLSSEVQITGGTGTLSDSYVVN